MNKDIKEKVARVLQDEAKDIQESEKDENIKLEKLNDILHVLMILDSFEELEPVIADYLNRRVPEKKYGADR